MDFVLLLWLSALPGALALFSAACKEDEETGWIDDRYAIIIGGLGLVFFLLNSATQGTAYALQALASFGRIGAVLFVAVAAKALGEGDAYLILSAQLYAPFEVLFLPWTGWLVFLAAAGAKLAGPAKKRRFGPFLWKTLLLLILAAGLAGYF